MKLILSLVGGQARRVPSLRPCWTWRACLRSRWEGATGKHEGQSANRHFLCSLYQMGRSQQTTKMPCLNDGTDFNTLPGPRKIGGGEWGNIHPWRMTSEASLRSADLTHKQSIIHKRAEKWSPHEQRRGSHSPCTRTPPRIESSPTKKGFSKKERKSNLIATKPFSEFGIWQQTDGRQGCQLATHQTVTPCISNLASGNLALSDSSLKQVIDTSGRLIQQTLCIELWLKRWGIQTPSAHERMTASFAVSSVWEIDLKRKEVRILRR